MNLPCADSNGNVNPQVYRWSRENTIEQALICIKQQMQQCRTQQPDESAMY